MCEGKSFVRDGVVDEDALNFLSASLLKWRKMGDNLEFLCRIKVQSSSYRREFVINNDSQITEKFKDM